MQSFAVQARSGGGLRMHEMYNQDRGLGGGDTAGQQAAALRAPTPISAETPVNPMQQRAYDRASDYESGLAEGTNKEITRELSRARDELSVGLAKEGEGAILRGADPSLFRSRRLEGGARNIHALQADLAGVALDKRAGAVGALTNAAGAAASEQRMTHFSALGQRLADQRATDEHAETQARLDAAPYDRLLTMMDTVGRNRNNFGILSGRGGVTSGGRGGVTMRPTLGMGGGR